MFISDFAIKRPMVTVVVILALVVFGLFSLAQLQTDEFPDIQQPIVNVARAEPERPGQQERLRRANMPSEFHMISLKSP